LCFEMIFHRNLTNFDLNFSSISQKRFEKVKDLRF
jgi:hypothetical protein